MRYAQQKRGQKLHLAYDLPTGGLTQPICGKKVDGYRLTINVPMGQSCQNCRRRINSKRFNPNEFLMPYFTQTTQLNSLI